MLTAPAPSRAIRGVLGKFADLPQEAEDEIRGLDEARRRIVALERQIKNVRSVHVAPGADQAAIGRAVTAAIEGERAAWHRKLTRARSRFRQVAAGLSSMGQSLDNVKGLLEEVDREWLTQSVTKETAGTSVNHRPLQVANPADDRIPSPEGLMLNGALKLASGERRILTALAQYRQGRSKVQVAVLTGYAATGGGFNNYLGALRSRGLIEGDGDRLTITEAGI
ncbi:MAG: hypothetical protein ACLQBA_12860 [Candidatus Binataceae bacterium]